MDAFRGTFVPRCQRNGCWRCSHSVEIEADAPPLILEAWQASGTMARVGVSHMPQQAPSSVDCRIHPRWHLCRQKHWMLPC